MQKLILASAMLMAAGAASAATYVAAPGAPDPGPGLGESILVDFEGPLPAGFMLTGDYGLSNTSNGSAAEPALDTSTYLYTSSALPGNTATLSTPNLKSISFYWGSIDGYNMVDVLGAGGTTLLSVGGSMISPANGDQSAPATNERVYFTAGAGEVITGLRFTSTGVAFEIDDVAGSAVPEPAAWALMLAGFGMVGAAARRRKAAVVAA